MVDVHAGIQATPFDDPVNQALESALFLSRVMGPPVAVPRLITLESGHTEEILESALNERITLDVEVGVERRCRGQQSQPLLRLIRIRTQNAIEGPIPAV